MSELSARPNIGKEIERQLNAVNIHTYEDLVRIGSQDAWLRIKMRDPSACINRLMALEGAIQNIRWHHLSDEDKQRLRAFYENCKSKELPL
jgi:TfoX C-terminal domain.